MFKRVRVRVRVMVFSATFSNVSVISWSSLLLVEDTGVPPSLKKNPANLSQVLDKLYHIMLYGVYLDMNGVRTRSRPRRHWFLQYTCMGSHVQTIIENINNTAPVFLGSSWKYIHCMIVTCLKDPEGYRVVLIFFPNKLLNIKSNSVTFRF